MMKMISRLLLVLTGVAMFGTATAGEQFRWDGANIYAQDYAYYTSYISAGSYCQEYPDGMGGTNVYGYTQIYGYINGAFVSEWESYNGADSCPDIFSNFGQSKKQDFEISLNGVTVSADCSEQATSHNSGNGQNKYPGQKPQNYTYTSSNHWNSDPYGDSCVITATNADGDVDDTFDWYKGASQSESFQNTNN